MNSTILKDGTALKDKWDHPSYPFRVFKCECSMVLVLRDVWSHYPHQISTLKP